MIKLFFLLVFSFCSTVSAQTGFKLKVYGEVAQPLELSLSDLSKMARGEAVMKDKEGNSHTFTGVPITEILGKAGVPSGKALHGKENFSKYVLIKCSDGYQVLFSLAELDPSIQDKNVIIADTIDGKPLLADKGPLRIIAEGEKKPARSSYQATEIVIGSIK
ncbi:molybdopterin-dependent oxidoreductase-like protein [Chryseobacterium sp. 7]|uniref:molybdopterin-dependent oxidoreductase n=1 Tax=Chryseobacterium sp. 7 TaxID=2035214 RepID=UPI000F1CE117|nr:molybdopterin-dependent oxidoreductase [Chryseobacterium sp. 7]RLJ31537.1 molybdopterin-dependent oxidoreductase-like protein [Chryseobacterium sp. 7]